MSKDRSIKEILRGLDIEYVEEVCGSKDIIESMFRRAGRYRIISNFVDRNIWAAELPEYVSKFINDYVVEENKSSYSRDLKNKVKSWFWNSQFSRNLPTKVYKKEKVEYSKYPVFVSYRDSVNGDDIVEIEIKEEDIIIDLSNIRVPNRKDKDILIEGEKYYKCRNI